MRTSVRQSGIFLFNIIPIYRPGMSRVFDYSRYRYSAASLPSSAQRIKQNTFFSGLEDQCGECLTDLDLLYVFATDGDRDYAKIDWKSPGDFDATEINTPTFTTNEGFTGIPGSSTYLNSGWAPDTDGVNFTQDEGGAFCYINNEISAGTKVAFGLREVGATKNICLQPKVNPGSGDQHGFAVNDSSIATTGSSVSSKGFYQIERTTSNDKGIYKNGALVANVGLASNGISTLELFILASNNLGTPALYSDAQISIFGIGASLTGKESALYTAWNNYFTSL